MSFEAYMRGSIDVVRPDGLIEGWCWNEASPEARISVTVLVDGIEVGSALAALYREDLRLANIGDGRHAFSFVTQMPPSNSKRTHTYTLIETDSRVPVGLPFVVRKPDSISFDNRLIELETRIRLLTARLEELSQRENQVSSSGLFAVVGDFFTRLSKDIEQGEPLTIERRLTQIVDAATRAHQPLSLMAPERPKMTILVQADCSLAQIHACLSSLQRAEVESIASIVVIDTGQAQDAVLVPSVARGIRYLRTITDRTLEWSEVEQAESTDFVMMLSGTAVVDSGFLTEIVESFTNNRNAAAIGAHALGPDNLVCGGGLCLLDGRLQDCSITGHTEAKVDMGGSYPVHALSYQAVAFRRSALQTSGGLDPAFGDDLGAAVIDLCFRLRRQGWSVLVQPLATLERQSAYSDESWLPAGLGGTSRAAGLVRARWLDPTVSHPPLIIGHAVVVGTPGSFEGELIAVYRLRERGYSVEFVGQTNMEPEVMTKLRRAGARVTLTTDVRLTLRACGATIVYAAANPSIQNSTSEDSQIVIGDEALQLVLSDDHVVNSTSDRAGVVDDHSSRPLQVQ